MNFSPKLQSILFYSREYYSRIPLRLADWLGKIAIMMKDESGSLLWSVDLSEVYLFLKLRYGVINRGMGEA